MTRIIQYILYFFLIIMVFSCEDREPDATAVPVWLKSQLEEIENSGECNGCSVQRWTYNNEYYYHLYCSNWSCFDCQIYQNSGDLVEWGDEIDHADFDQNKQRPVKIWECGDEL